MAQLCDFVTNPEKPRDWHLSFLRELLEHVKAESPTERRYVKWLRERKVFDRKFLAFAERLTGIERAPLQPPSLGEVARDLLDAIDKQKKKLEEDAEKARLELQKKPGRDMPKPAPSKAAPAKAANPEDELDEDKAFAAGGAGGPEGPHAKWPAAPVATDDLFVKAVLERAVELNGYLAKFVYRELGDDFLAVTEIFRRLSTSAFAGRRPALPQFEAWVRWQEWLGGLQKVGFRHKATAAGKDHGKALKDVPDSELTVATREDDLVIEAPAPAAPAPAPIGGALVANAPTGRRSLEVREDDDEDADEDSAAEEGLELPPAAAPHEAPEGGYWANKTHDDAATPRGPLPDTVIAPKPFSDVMKELTAATASIADSASPEAPAPPPPVVAAPAPSPPPPVAPAPLPPPVVAAAPSSSQSQPVMRGGAASPAALLVAWWRQAGRPGERLTAREAGIDLSLYRGPQRGVAVFKLLALGALLEATPRARGLAFFRELAARSAFEALYHEEAALDRVVDLDPARPLVFGAPLVALLRFRRALKKDGLLARLDGASDGRELARTLRREVTGDALSTGVVLAVREMAQAGHWRAPGVDSLACVPWREVREAGWRLGLLGAPSASTFEDVLAASEALSAHFSAADEHEVPLRAFAAREPLPERGALP